MGEQAANEGARWAMEADRNGPKLVTHDRTGARVDEIDYHHSYRALQQLGYGGGIIAASYAPALEAERGQAPKTLTFGLGYLFAQAEAGTTRRFGGTGLGLALSRELVSLMGGTLVVQSQESVGTALSFSLVLPASLGSLLDHEPAPTEPKATGLRRA
jgi:hypothetical protein